MNSIPFPCRLQSAGSFIFMLLCCLLGHGASAQQPAFLRPVESFLYIGDAEVRHELLMPLRALESLMPVQTDDPEVLTVAEQEAAVKVVLELLDSMNRMTIDGIEVAASGGKVVYFDNQLTDIIGDVPKVDIPSDNVIAGVILRYETKGAPMRAAIQWSAFNDVITAVRATVYTAEGDRKQVLNPSQPLLEWVREGAPQLPVMTQVPEPKKAGWFRGAPKVTEDEANAIFAALLKNIYRAFDYYEESAIYDALERSVAGEMLGRLYLNIRRGLEIEAEGGPTVRVLGVEIVDTVLVSAAEGGRKFVIDSDWAVTGSVEHWGHLHTRKNLYRARFSIAVTNNAWKINDLAVSKQERLQTNVVKRGSADAP